MTGRPRVLVVSLGGTIAMTRGDNHDRGVAPQLDGDDLVAAVPGIDDVAQIETVSFRQLPGAHLAVDDLVALAEAIAEAASDSVAGVVVTQGTDTIEETAFLLDLLLDIPEPVVITGAMRNPTLAGADGPANLLAAAQVAASSTARGLGALVVFNDEIHAARYVQKTHTSSQGAFASVPGPLGWVSEGEPRILVRPTTRVEMPRPPRGPTLPVALITASLEDDGRVLTALDELGFSAVVVEALGGGHVPAEMAAEIGRLTERMPVVLASRTGRGEVLRRTYEFPGSESDLLERGVIPGGWLGGPKARTLLMVLLKAGLERDEIAREFDKLVFEPGGRDRVAGEPAREAG